MSLSNHEKSTIAKAIRILCNKKDYLTCIERRPDVIEAVCRSLEKQNIDYRILSKEGAPHVKLSINTGAPGKDINLYAKITYYISKIAPIVKYNQIPLHPHWEDDDYDEMVDILSRRNTVSDQIYDVFGSFGYGFFHYSLIIEDITEIISNTCPSLKECFEPTDLVANEIYFGDPLNHLGLGRNYDWDIKRCSEDEDEDDIDDLWWDEPKENDKFTL